MASNYSGVLQQFIAQFLLRLRASQLATLVVDRSFDPVPAGRGNTINVTYPTTYTAKAITPGAAPVAGDDATPTEVALTLDQWYDVSTNITDKQLGEIQRGIFDAEQDSLVVGLCEQINASIYGAGNGFYNVSGTAGTNPFATDETPLLTAIQLLDQARAPTKGRVGILTPAMKAKALKIQSIAQYIARGDDASDSPLPVVTGMLGDAYGVGLMMDQLLPTHTATAFTAGAVTANGVNAIAAGSTDGGRTGTISIAKATNTSPLVAGDVLTVTGDPQTYVVTAATTLAIGNTTVPIAPALKQATAGGEVIVLTATSQAGLIMYPKAITFASRPVASLDGVGDIFTVNDPQTGLSITAEIQRQHYQSKLAVSCLWGVKAFRPEFGVRLLG